MTRDTVLADAARAAHELVVGRKIRQVAGGAMLGGDEARLQTGLGRKRHGVLGRGFRIVEV